jgi:beta-N-acetylhexosaminidase
MVEKGLLGGVISRGTILPATAEHSVEYVNELQAKSPIPLLMMEDFEFGVGYLIRGATEFTSSMGVAATGDPKCAYEAGRISAVESRALGFHSPLSPILDVNVNPKNPIINIRSFGEDPEKVAEFGLAYMKGVEEHGALACGKHFPGHGDTDMDSHRMLPVILHDRRRMDAVELAPFRRCIDNGISLIMSAHIVFPAVDPTPGLPATLSRKILTGLLREELGFKGIICTDAMAMKAIADNFPRGEAEVRAIEAGADFVLCIASRTAHEAVLRAAMSGRLTVERLRESVRRVFAAKKRMGLTLRERVDPAAAGKIVGCRAHREAALDIARRSMTLLRGKTPCLDASKTTLAVIVRAKRFTGIESHEAFAAELRRHTDKAICVFVDESPAEGAAAEVAKLAKSADQALFATCARVEAYKPTSGGHAATQEEIVHALASAKKTFTAVSFGSPYVLVRLDTAHNLLAGWYDGDACLQAGCEVMFGKIPARGTIPGPARANAKEFLERARTP